MYKVGDIIKMNNTKLLFKVLKFNGEHPDGGIHPTNELRTDYMWLKCIESYPGSFATPGDIYWEWVSSKGYTVIKNVEKKEHLPEWF